MSVFSVFGNQDLAYCVWYISSVGFVWISMTHEADFSGPGPPVWRTWASYCAKGWNIAQLSDEEVHVLVFEPAGTLTPGSSG